MLSTLNKHINESDIGYIDYSVGGRKNQSNNPLNDIFCDNIFVFTPIENRYLFQLNDNNEREIDIKHIPKELQGKTTANFKFAFSHIGLSINKQQIKPTRIKFIAHENYFNRCSDYIQIDFNQFPSDKDIGILSNAGNFNFSSDNKIFIKDLDSTRDFTGPINIEENVFFTAN